MGRKASARSKWGWRLVAALVLLAALGGGWLWWEVQHWRPSEDAYPDQGVLVGEGQGNVNFRTLAAIGADFAYLRASGGSTGQDARFARNFARAGEAGLKVGAVHAFDPCAKAGPQSANFVTMVPRTQAMLPPAIALTRTAQGCAEKVSDAAVESELLTFINQVELHTGKPVLLRVAPEFEAAYGVSTKLDRQLWLVRTRFEPGYAARPWLLWSANEALVTEAGEEPLEWVVVRP